MKSAAVVLFAGGQEIRTRVAVEARLLVASALVAVLICPLVQCSSHPQRPLRLEDSVQPGSTAYVLEHGCQNGATALALEDEMFSTNDDSGKSRILALEKEESDLYKRCSEQAASPYVRDLAIENYASLLVLAANELGSIAPSLGPVNNSWGIHGCAELDHLAYDTGYFGVRQAALGDEGEDCGGWITGRRLGTIVTPPFARLVGSWGGDAVDAEWGVHRLRLNIASSSQGSWSSTFSDPSLDDSGNATDFESHDDGSWTFTVSTPDADCKNVATVFMTASGELRGTIESEGSNKCEGGAYVSFTLARGVTPSGRPIYRVGTAVPTRAALIRAVYVLLQPAKSRHGELLAPGFAHDPRQLAALLDVGFYPVDRNTTIDDIRGRLVDLTISYSLQAQSRLRLRFLRRDTWRFVHGRGGWLLNHISISDQVLTALIYPDGTRYNVTNSRYAAATGRVTFSIAGIGATWVEKGPEGWSVQILSTPRPAATPRIPSTAARPTESAIPTQPPLPRATARPI